MTTRVTVWGTAGRIFADRQECQVYLRDGAPLPPGYEQGWNVRYTTELTEPVWFYLRGEEYSAQIDHFIERVGENAADGVNGFESAADHGRVIAHDARRRQKGSATAAPTEKPRPGADAAPLDDSASADGGRAAARPAPGRDGRTS